MVDRATVNGLRGKVPHRIFVVVLGLGELKIELDNGTKVRYEELHTCLRIAHVITHAYSRELVLHGRARLENGGARCGIKHLYVRASRATSSDLLTNRNLERAN